MQKRADVHDTPLSALAVRLGFTLGVTRNETLDDVLAPLDAAASCGVTNMSIVANMPSTQRTTSVRAPYIARARGDVRPASFAPDSERPLRIRDVENIRTTSQSDVTEATTFSQLTPNSCARDWILGVAASQLECP
jgi:hypothetical protein